ncbi:hypothetical protein, partial [Coprobacter fastidiosus]|uniref:hypothetical protein n=1 Tax=Coprobacter fastidiosus TaxID=1099853 RepID=UPI00267069FD
NNISINQDNKTNTFTQYKISRPIKNRADKFLISKNIDTNKISIFFYLMTIETELKLILQKH